MRVTIRWSAFLLPLALIAACESPSRAQSAASIIARMKSAYAGARTYRATMSVDTTLGAMVMRAVANITTEGKKFRETATMSGLPGAAGAKGGMESLSVSDGKDLYMYIPMLNRYMVRPLSSMSSAPSLFGSMGEGAGVMPWQMTLPNASYKLLPPATVNGRRCYVVQTTQSLPNLPNSVVKFFIDRSTYHLKQLHLSGNMGQPINMAMTIQKEQFNVPVSPSTFHFTPPKGATPMQMPAGAGPLGGR